MAAAHEIPPHDDLFLERGSAHEDRPGGCVRLVGQGHRAPARRQVAQFRRVQKGSVHADAPLVDQESVLEGAVRAECRRRTRIQDDLGAEQRGEGGHRRGVVERAGEEDPDRGAVPVDGVRRVVPEVASGVPVLLGEGHPQLDAVQDRGAGGGHLRMADPMAPGHQVQLAGTYEGVAAQAVAVLDLPAEQPADGLQADVRMRGHVHPARPGDVVGAVVVDEAPRADEGAGPLRKRAPHRHRPGAAQRYVTRRQHLDRGVRLRPPRPSASACGGTLPVSATLIEGPPARQ